MKKKLTKFAPWVFALWLAFNTAKAERLKIELPPQPKSLLEYLSANHGLYPEFKQLDSLASQSYEVNAGKEKISLKLPEWFKPFLPTQLMVESRLKPKAVSTDSAMGIGQLKPITVRHLKELGYEINPFNPIENIKGTVVYLAWCDYYLEKFSSYYPKFQTEKKIKWLLAAFKEGPRKVLEMGVPKSALSYIRVITKADPFKLYEKIKETSKKPIPLEITKPKKPNPERELKIKQTSSIYDSKPKAGNKMRYKFRRV